MKDDLVGRVVGYPVPHRLDPSQVDPGEPLDTTRTVWGRVVAMHPRVVRVLPIHGTNPQPYMVHINQIHTVMPESYER